MTQTNRNYSLDDALRAQRALREMAGLGPETFPVQAFVGMVSDEIEQLRNMGRSDQEIVDTIKASSTIELTAAELAGYYASPEARHSSGE